MKRSRMTRAAFSACAAIAAAAALASPAHAGVLTTSATDCADATLTQPFRPWGDYSHYKLVENGAFESGTGGWVLAGGARVVSGNATQRVHGAGDVQSLL